MLLSLLVTLRQQLSFGNRQGVVTALQDASNEASQSGCLACASEARRMDGAPVLVFTHAETKRRVLPDGTILCECAAFEREDQKIDISFITSHVGLMVWPSGLVLARHLHSIPVKGLRVLELGAGTGLVGLSLAAVGAHVDLTDDDPLVLEQIARSVRANSHLPGQLRVFRYQWGSKDATYWGVENRTRIDIRSQRYDMVLGADVVYLENR